MQPFDLSLRVQGNMGRQDKIDFTMNVGFLFDPNDSTAGVARERSRRDSAAFTRYIMGFLAGPRVDEENLVNGLDSPHSRIFGRPHGRKGNVLKVLERHRGNRPNAPLISGQLVCSEGTRGTIGFAFTAYANLTRYVRHQTSAAQLDRGHFPQDNVQLFETLFSRGGLISTDEFSLDGNDNWMLRGSRAQHLYRNWQQRQLDYFEAIQLAIFNELERAVRNSEAIGHPLNIARSDGERLSLQNVETYWEFLSADPLQLVESLHDDLVAYCEGEFERREFESQSPSQSAVVERRLRNCPVLYANVATGLALVIYAKTNMRVRFEIRHDLSEVTPRLRLLQTCQNPAQAVARLAEIADHASQVLNRFLAFLQSRRTPPSTSYSPVELIFRCNRCCESPQFAESILSMLITNNCVVFLKPLERSLKRMQRDGLIQRSPNDQGQQAQTFSITSPFIEALETLRAVSGSRRFTGRGRTRSR